MKEKLLQQKRAYFLKPSQNPDNKVRRAQPSKFWSPSTRCGNPWLFSPAERDEQRQQRGGKIWLGWKRATTQEELVQRYSSGQTVVEIMVVVAMVSIFFAGMFSFLILSQTTFSDQSRRAEGITLAQEGLEAVRAVRDKSWSTNIAPLTLETNYYATTNSNEWQLSTANPGAIQNLFTRTLVFHATARDSDDNIATSGTDDPNTRRVTSTVLWQERGKSRQIQLETYFTNFQDN